MCRVKLVLTSHLRVECLEHVVLPAADVDVCLNVAAITDSDECA